MEANKNSDFLLELKYCFQSKVRIYFVSEFIEGGNVYDRVTNGSLYNEESLKFIAAQIVLALNELHKRKIIHRDLKPENVLIKKNGYIVLADYGLAKIATNDSQTKTICGTPGYHAPEILKDKDQTFAVDWWWFGVTLYELFTGKTPFGSNYNNIIYGNKFYWKSLSLALEAQNCLDEPGVKKIKASAQFKDLIKKLLKKEPEKRLGFKGVIKIMMLFSQLMWKTMSGSETLILKTFIIRM